MYHNFLLTLYINGFCLLSLKIPPIRHLLIYWTLCIFQIEYTYLKIQSLHPQMKENIWLLYLWVWVTSFRMIISGWTGWDMPLIPGLRQRGRWVSMSLRPSMTYKLSSRSTRTTQKLCLDKKKTKQNVYIQAHPLTWEFHSFVLLNSWVIFNLANVPHFYYPFNSLWAPTVFQISRAAMNMDQQVSP